MTREHITRITTTDTKKTYELPCNAPQLWEVKLSVSLLDMYGNSSKYYHEKGSIFLERQTLVEHGLLPCFSNDVSPNPEQSKTAEDLILELLAHLGVYPES